jgi:hypothetical protein
MMGYGTAASGPRLEYWWHRKDAGAGEGADAVPVLAREGG